MIRRTPLFTAALAAAALVAVSSIPVHARARGASKPAMSTAAREYAAQSGAELKAARASYRKLLGTHGTAALEAYNDLLIHLDKLGNLAGLMQEVHPDSNVRAAAERMVQEAGKLNSELSTDPRVYKLLAAVDVKDADDATKFFVFKQLRDFRRSGVDRDADTRKRLRALDDSMVAYAQKFDVNISSDNGTLQLPAKDLDGMPDDFVKGHPADKDGKVTLTTQYPDVYPFLTYAKSAAAREAVQRRFLNRAYPASLGVLDTLLQLRYEYASILGYRNWAAYVTETSMIGTDTAAARFIDRVTQISDRRMRADLDELLERKRKDEPSATALNYWDGEYYTEIVKNEKYKFSSQEVRPYFEYDRVKKGILALDAKMFGLQFRQVKLRMWHPSVEVFDVYDAGRKIGRFYLDMHPRPNKYSHAANFQMVTGVKGRQYPEACLVCNLPEGRNGEPSLLEHDDVETFFHEFGHLLHHILGGQQHWIANSGIATEQDFVEAPSQLLEEWVWDTAVLQSFARHYKTGEPIPAELVERMRAAREAGKGIWVRQQMFYAAMSLDFHQRDPRGMSTTDELQLLQARYSPWAYVPDTHLQASFGHISNYSASYYTYMWSMVIAKDLFSRFQGHSLLDPEVPTLYRHKVLMPGGTKPAAQLVRDFLGREYDTRAYEDWLNKSK